MDRIRNALDSVLPERLRVTREPIAYLVAGVAAMFAVYKVIYEGMPLTEVVGENYVEGAMLGLTGLLARLSVYSPRSVKDVVSENTAQLTGTED